MLIKLFACRPLTIAAPVVRRTSFSELRHAISKNVRLHYRAQHRPLSRTLGTGLLIFTCTAGNRMMAQRRKRVTGDRWRASPAPVVPERTQAGTMIHVILLGDSVFDNGGQRQSQRSAPRCKATYQQCRIKVLDVV